MRLSDPPARTLSRRLPCTLLLALLASSCARTAAPPLYVFSLRASQGPAPVIAVAYSRVVGPPVEVPRAAEAGVAFLRPGPRGLDLIASARRTAALHATLHAHPTYLHGAVGGAVPWVAIADEEWTSPHEALATRDLRGRARAPLAGRAPVGMLGGFVSLDETTLAAVGDDGRQRWRRPLETAAPTACVDDEPDVVETLPASSPGGTVVAAVRAAVHRGAACIETVARLARVAPDGTRRGPDAVLRLVPPEDLWAAAPEPSRYGTSAVHLAVRDDGTTLLALSTRQPGTSLQGSDLTSVRLFEVSPDGTLRALRAIPGAALAVASAGSSWLVFLEAPGGGAGRPLIVVASDGHPLGDLAIPRRHVAIVSFPDRAFVAWRANEHDVCGVPIAEDGRRSRMVCRRVVP